MSPSSIPSFPQILSPGAHLHFSPVAGDGPRRQNQFQSGRECAARALVTAGSTATEVGRAESGAPIWPVGWVGSISHTRGIAVAAVARSEDRLGMGIDVEQIMSEAQAQRLRGRILTSVEQDLFDSVSELAPNQLITLMFSIKESVYKCWSAAYGEALGFHDICVTHLDCENGKITLRGMGEGRFAIMENHVFTVFELFRDAKNMRQ